MTLFGVSWTRTCELILSTAISNEQNLPPGIEDIIGTHQDMLYSIQDFRISSKQQLRGRQRLETIEELL